MLGILNSFQRMILFTQISFEEITLSSKKYWWKCFWYKIHVYYNFHGPAPHDPSLRPVVMAAFYLWQSNCCIAILSRPWLDDSIRNVTTYDPNSFQYSKTYENFDLMLWWKTMIHRMSLMIIRVPEHLET